MGRRPYDRRMPKKDTTRINEMIRGEQVRLIGADGEQVGVVQTSQALEEAVKADLDLVEVSPESKPPVCRILDYSKYKYELEQKRKAARKHQQLISVREMKLRPKIAVHDYETKKNHIERFLKEKAKVKVTIMFRGREMQYPQKGRELLERLAEDLIEVGMVEHEPLMEGRNMFMVLAPGKGTSRAKPKPPVRKVEVAPAEAEAASEAPQAEAEVVEPAEVVDAEPKVEAEPEKSDAVEAEAEKPETIEVEAVEPEVEIEVGKPDVAEAQAEPKTDAKPKVEAESKTKS